MSFLFKIPMLCVLIATIAHANGEVSLISHSFHTLDGSEQRFATADGTPKLLLFVTEQKEFKEAFRIATITPSSQTPYECYIIVDLSNLAKIKAFALKKAANNFFKSDISRQSIAFLNTDSIQQVLYSHGQSIAKSALIDSKGTITWTCDSFPGEPMLKMLNNAHPCE